MRTITLGNFDGVHLGHRSVIENAISDMDETVPVCFEPVARQYFADDEWRRRLTTVHERSRLLSSMGLRRTVVIPFDIHTIEQEPGVFLDELRERENFRRVVVGYDFHFGRKRSGNAEYLRQWCTSRGIDTIIVPPLEIGGGPVKSERIRLLLEDGDLESAKDLLGRFYSLTGVVARGKGFGRELGFPTLNIRVPRCKLLPLPGSYCGHVYYSQSGRWMPAGVFIPEGGMGPVEAFLPDVSLGECYGTLARVIISRRIRDVVHVKDTHELKELIAGDMEVVRHCAKEDERMEDPVV